MITVLHVRDGDDHGGRGGHDGHDDHGDYGQYAILHDDGVHDRVHDARDYDAHSFLPVWILKT